MRALLLALLLAAAFGAAALWQREHYAALRAEQLQIEHEQDAVAAATPSGVLEAGQAVLVVGRPSGGEALVRPGEAAPAKPGPDSSPEESAPADPDLPAPGQLLGVMELEVQPGQTLSGLAHLYYGAHGSQLLKALAEYNGLEDPDSLRAGSRFRLPALETLEALGR